MSLEVVLPSVTSRRFGSLPPLPVRDYALRQAHSVPFLEFCGESFLQLQFGGNECNSHYVAGDLSLSRNTVIVRNTSIS